MPNPPRTLFHEVRAQPCHLNPQGIYLNEHRDRGGSRSIMVTLQVRQRVHGLGAWGMCVCVSPSCRKVHPLARPWGE